MTEFEVIKKDTNSAARVGVIKDDFGTQMTPLYIFAGTNGHVRTLSPQDLKDLAVGGLVANTFHLWQNPGHLRIKEQGGLHRYMNFDQLIMTDSGGFQVFSYGFAREHGVLKIANIFPGEESAPPAGGRRSGYAARGENLVRITDDGVHFSLNGKEEFLDAKKSIEIQEALGADIMLAFDECTSPRHDYEYTKKSLERTHRWAKESIAARTGAQSLFGIVQGGNFRDLREESANYIGSLPFDGFAIGGPLGNTKKDMHQILDWVVPILDKAPNKQRHLLGIGQPDDLFHGIERGIDTFDCVIPTREARHGTAWTKYGKLDLEKSASKNNKDKIEGDCICTTCTSYTRGELHEMRKAKDQRSGPLLTIHNIHFFQTLMEQIRQSILHDRFPNFKQEFLSGFKKNAL